MCLENSPKAFRQCRTAGPGPLPSIPELTIRQYEPISSIVSHRRVASAQSSQVGVRRSRVAGS